MQQNAIAIFRAGFTATSDNLAQNAIADFRTMDTETLISALRNLTRNASSAHVTSGKIIAAITEKETVKNITSFITKKLGEKPHDHALMCAVSFDMVAETGVHGTISEGLWDTTPLGWHLQISPILKYLAKEEAPDETVAQVREEIARIIREKPANGLDMLKALKKALKGEPEAAGGGEGGEEEPAEIVEPVFDIDATIDRLAAAVDAIEDIERLKAISALLGAIADSAKLRTEPVRKQQQAAA